MAVVTLIAPWLRTATNITPSEAENLATEAWLFSPPHVFQIRMPNLPESVAALKKADAFLLKNLK